MAKPKTVLVNLRDPSDEMCAHEARCFAEHLGIAPSDLTVHSMVNGAPVLDGIDMILFGGSGDYSVLDYENVPWIAEGLEVLLRVVDRKIPAWASCFGFQGLALALGGTVNRDATRTELGSVWLELTDEGRNDPLFSSLPDAFWAQQGHQDHVDVIPAGVTRTVTGGAVDNQAFKLDKAPFWAAQFHPELTTKTTIDRALHYQKKYISDEDAGSVLDGLAGHEDTPEVNQLLRRWREIALAY